MTNNKLRATAKRKKSVRRLNFVLLIFALAIVSACRSDEESSVNAVSSSPTAETKKKDDFEEALTTVRTGNFDFVLAFRRLDGDIFSSDDKKFVKANAPIDTNQWVLTTDGKCVLAGSNYKFTPEQLEALKKRFNIEDYSPQKSDVNNQNTVNTNQNSGTANNQQGAN